MHDLAGACWGVFVFAAALVAPGFCLAHLVNLADFRIRALREQLAWSVALSFGPGVLLVLAAVWLGGVTAGAVSLALMSLATVWLARRYPPCLDVTRRETVVAVTVLLAWAVIVLGSLVDIGVHGRLWMSVTAYDHGLRTAFLDAVLRTGVVPINPVYWPGHDTPMRYYYFWYVVCAAVARLAHISGRQALIASCVWPPVGVVAMLALFGRYMLGRRGRELTHLTLTAAALLGVAGLDLLVTIALRILGDPVLPDMEWWSIDQVSSWPDTFLWVPHHAAALVAALLGLLILLRAGDTESRRSRAFLAVLAGWSFASAFGMSAYIAVAVALVICGWLLVSLREPRMGRRLGSTAIACLVSAATLSGFLRELFRRNDAEASAGSPMILGIREILSPDMLTGSALFRSLAQHHPWRARELAAAVLLLPGWAVELGFYAIVLLVALVRRRSSSKPERTLLWLTLAGLIASSVFRSNVIANNDYGIRSALLPQFFLLLLGALVFVSSRGSFRRFLWLLLVVGAGGCVYQVVFLRTYIPWQQTHSNPEIREVGERTYALREAYAAFQSRAPARARIQFDVSATSFFLYPHLFSANRQMITAEATCSTSFGGARTACPAIQSGITRLFPTDAASTPDAALARSLCSHLGADYLVATRWDRAWASRSGWVWTLSPVVDQPSVRILSCIARPQR